MADFSLDDILGQFGEKSTAPKKSGLDLDSILSEFGDKTSYGGAIVEPGKPTKVIINTNPAPPISGLSKEASDEFIATKGESGNPKSMPVESPILTSKGAYNQHVAGKALFNEGMSDLESGRPYRGLGKTALGVVQILGAPAGGLVEDFVVEPGNKIAPGFGDRDWETLIK